MNNLLDFIISCNKTNPTKMESSLRAFHWFTIENFIVYDEISRKLRIKQDGSNSNYHSLELLSGDKAYKKENNSRNTICDGVFYINNDRTTLIMVEIKAANSLHQKSDFREQVQF